MFEFLTADQNLPFAIALVVMIGIALLEGISVLFGAALSDLIDAILPEMPDADLSLDGGDINTPNTLSRLLGWLRIGQVPVLMLLVVFLTSFGLIGLGLQSITQGVLGFFLPSLMASLIALVLSLPLVRLLGGLLAKILPKDETDAVKIESLVGRVATITIGKASAGRPAEAKLRDSHGTTHYLMVEPDNPEEVFSAGEPVLLVRLDGHRFRVIAGDNPSLTDN